MGKYIVSFDSGTQSVKTLILNKEGVILGEGHSPHSVNVPAPMRAEQDPNQWWSAFCDSMKIAFQKSGIRPSEIAAIGITNQRETMCAVDSNGNPVIPAQVWYDSRSIPQVARVRADFGAEEYMKVTGRMPDTTWWVMKVMWVKDNLKETFAKVHKFLTVSGFFVYKLTGEFKDSYASSPGIHDMMKIDYSTEVLNRLDIPREKLCDLFPPGSIIGRVSAKAAKETGLPEGTPVAAGAGDQQAGGLGCGLTKAGAAYLNLGTSVVLGVISSKYVYHQNFFVREGCVSGTWNLEALINGGYWMVTWFKENFAQPEMVAAQSQKLSVEKILESAAEKIPAGSLGLVVQPYWLGVRQPYWDENARGTIIGWNNAHTRIHLYRAIIEGIAYDIRLNLEGFEDAIGIKIDDIRVFGGGAKSNLSCNIMADVLGRQVTRVATPEATALGAAILAAYAAGMFDTIDEAVQSMTSVGEKFNTNEKNAATYTDLYSKIYRPLYPSLQQIMKGFPK
jgi:xylulokinase